MTVHEQDGGDGPTPAEQRLAHLAAVVDASSDAIVTKNLDGTITSWNASAERIFGYTAGEIVGSNVRRLIPEDLRAEEDDILAKLRAGVLIEHYETVRLTKDGRRLDVSLSISPVKDGEGRIVGASKIARDITASRQAAEALRESEERFRSITSIITDVVWTADADGRFLPPQPAWESYTGQGPEVYGGHRWLQALHPEDRERVRAGWDEATANVTLFEAEGRLWNHTAGAHRHVVVRATPIRREDGSVGEWVGACSDVHERTVAEEAFRKLEAEEREIALGLQRALLPERLDVPEGLAFAARYEAGSDVLEVGGDWYDAFQLRDGRVAVMVGDVVGHGLAAAAAMGQLRTALAALADQASGPGDALMLLDRYLGRAQPTDFATVCYGIVDPTTGRFEYSSAGHPPMLLISPRGETELLEGAQATPLVGDGRPRPATSIALEPGSLLVLYSDGLVERRGEPIGRGLERLAEAGRDLAGEPVEDVLDRLVLALGVDTRRDDDVVVLVLRIDGVGGPAFHHVFPASPEQLRELRAAMRQWLDARRVDAPAKNAALLAVGEASANAIEHAYLEGEPGEVVVDIVPGTDGALLVVVRDSGRFKVTADPDGDRGRGTDIMRGLSTDFIRESTPAGTTVRFRLPVDDAAPA